jgi:hypothetical protein
VLVLMKSPKLKASARAWQKKFTESCTNEKQQK